MYAKQTNIKHLQTNIKLITEYTNYVFNSSLIMIGSEYEIQVRSIYAGNIESSPTSTYFITGMNLQICINVMLCAKKLAFISARKDTAFLAFSIYLDLFIHSSEIILKV